MADPALIQALRVTIADSFTLYLTAHAAHWNVEGPQFASLHEFFGDLYEDVYGAIDHFAESMRQHEVFAPSTFDLVLKHASFTTKALEDGNAASLIDALSFQNSAMMDTLRDLCKAAEAADDEGLSNFVQERLGAHLKTDWQLRALSA